MKAETIYRVFYECACELNLQKDNILYLVPTDDDVYFRLELACFVNRLFTNMKKKNTVYIFIWATTTQREEDGDELTEGPWTTPIYQAHEGPILAQVRRVAQTLNLPREHVLFYLPDYADVADLVASFVSRVVYTCHKKTKGGLIWFECNEIYDDGVLAKMLGYKYSTPIVEMS
jgi:hypothetical protein